MTFPAHTSLAGLRGGLRRRGPVALVAVALAACVYHPPAIDGGQAAPPDPNKYWTPAPGAVPAVTPPPVPTFVPDSLRQLTIPAAVDIALKNNPNTRASWAEALASAYAYGSSQGRLLPSITVGAALSNGYQATGGGALRTTLSPSASLSYLVFDFGGRNATIDAARDAAIAADYTHNSTVQNTILGVESAMFNYLATRALLDADSVTVAETDTALVSTREQHRVGLAQIGDTLQAATALLQAQLTLETLQGSLQIAHGQVAVAMGIPGTTKFDLPETQGGDSVAYVAQTVDSLIQLAERARPDLAAVRAEAQQAAAEVAVTRSAGLPALSLSTSVGYNAAIGSGSSAKAYTLNLGVSYPIFTGFSQQNDEKAAAALFDAANARTEITRQQIDLDVMTSYYSLQTATIRVKTSSQGLDAATQSEQVALGRYRAGVGSITDLLAAQTALATARSTAVQARWDWREAVAQLAHDLGIFGIHGESPLLRLGPVPPPPGGPR